jgi:hypothetical protein
VLRSDGFGGVGTVTDGDDRVITAYIRYTAPTHTGVLFGYGDTEDDAKADLRASLRDRGYRVVGMVTITEEDADNVHRINTNDEPSQRRID